MRLLLSRFIVAVAFSFLLMHNLVPHHHHDEIEITQHQDDEHDHHDDLFSCVVFADNFLPAKNVVISSLQVSSQLFFSPATYRVTHLSFFKHRNEFISYQEFPAPQNYLYSFLLRGPPVII